MLIEYHHELDHIERNYENTRQFLKGKVEYTTLNKKWKTRQNVVMMCTYNKMEYRLITRDERMTIFMLRLSRGKDIGVIGTPCYHIQIWETERQKYNFDVVDAWEKLTTYFPTKFVIAIIYNKSLINTQRLMCNIIVSNLFKAGYYIYVTPPIRHKLKQLLTEDEVMKKLSRCRTGHYIFISAQPLPFDINKEHDVYQSSTPYV